MFLATVITVYKSGIHLEGVGGGSTFAYLHICSHGSPWKAVHSSDPACIRFIALKAQPCLSWVDQKATGRAVLFAFSHILVTLSCT